MIDSFFKYIQGIVKLRGNTDNALIGNTGDRLRTAMRVDWPGQTDSIGRIVAGTPRPFFNSILEKNKLPEFFDEALAGSATSEHNANTSSVDMSVTTADGDSVIRQTFRRFLYLTGHGTRVSWTANYAPLETNLIQRSGPFDDDDGMFIELSGTEPKAVVRSSTSGAPVETVKPRSEWNIDKLDGTGPSGININFENHTLFVINYLWQGAGCARFGIIYGGDTIYFHCFNFSNTLKYPYTKTPHLPFRHEIINNGGTTTPATMSVSCVTFETEGSGIPTKVPHAVSNEFNFRSVDGSFLPLISVRPSATYPKTMLDLDKISILADSNNAQMLYKITIGGVVNGGTWDDTIPGLCEVNTSATSVTGGTDVESSYIVAGSRGLGFETTVARFVDALLGLALDGNRLAITVQVLSAGGGVSTVGSIDYREI